MTDQKFNLIFIAALACVMSLTAKAKQPWQAVSPAEQTTLIELYTSEGCSSCPPADNFLSGFKHSEELWTEHIPLAFHVDYWDYIGWTDPLAKPAHSNRQRQHARIGNIDSVYTPGFVVNGEEWTGFFKLWRSLPESNGKPGKLTATLDGHQASVHFEQERQLRYHLAIVGMGIKSEVNAGENVGQTLEHDFVVLDHQELIGQSAVVFDLPLIRKHGAKQLGLIAWVSSLDQTQTIQAVGSYLPEGLVRSL